ncbi:metal-binding protein [Clostridium sp. YIM B02515]|uniref:Metal-binding protein n=1 Tax=Clostridium rhizosphaerae TaxID=2803861 RepID=A0ABS1TAJ2_9CLOT|nr:metal-binding protein [Clostridium rhizosphaerae]MBL4936378.1 metal-binding protein [Clostridium rhizosphaerae]
MTVRDIMKYIESEYKVINHTPCEMCGGDFLTEEIQVAVIDNIPYDICSCICSNCGHERVFEFGAPFIEDKVSKKLRKNLN